MPDYAEFLRFAVQVACAAGRVIRAGTQRPLEVKQKTSPRDLLTDVDLAADRAIVEAIRGRYPDHDVLTEERAPEERSSPYCWVIDPIDGTGNFIHRYPSFSTSIALTCGDEPIVGVVYDPMRDHTFAAARGGGATWNSQPIRVSQTERWVDALVGMDWVGDPSIRAQSLGVIAQLIQQCNGTRTCGSAALALCYVAAGWWDAYFHLRLSPWDVAAGALIVREAGGQVTDIAGQRWKLEMAPCIASNGRMHDELCAYVRAGVDSAQSLQAT